MPFSLYALALAIFVMGTSEFLLAGLLPAIAADLDVSVGSAGLLISAFALGMVVGAPLMAAFARRWPPRSTLLVCVLVFAACHVIGAVTSVFGVLLLTRIVGAVANAGFLAVALTTATALVTPDRTGRAVAILLSGTTIATVAGVPGGALLGTAFGWRAPFWIIAALCVPAALGVLRGVAPRPAEDRAARDRPRLRSELALLATRPLLLALALAALVNGGTFAAFTFLAPVVTEVAGLPELWVPVTLVLFGVGSFLGVTLAGRLADRHPGVVLGVGGPLLLVGWMATALLAVHPAVLLGLVLVQGVLSFGVGSTLIARVLLAAAGAPTMGGSYATAALNVGAVVGPALGAAALATAEETLAPLGVATALTAIALGLGLLFRRTLVARP